MKTFDDIEAVESWLEPMDYPGFWFAVEPLELTLQDRTHCDHQIAQGRVPAETILFGLKALARKELIQRLKLKHRKLTPWVRLAEAH